MNNEAQSELVDTIRHWAAELGFQDIGFTGIELNEHEAYLQKWLDAGYQGTMEWMDRHGTKRSRPSELVPGTCTVISCRMDYQPEAADAWQVMSASEKGFISRYAVGRDYHKIIRSRLAKLADRIRQELGSGEFRAFVDSAPVLERAVAEQSGLGWIAKNTMLINESAGSYFFLGEIYTNIPLPHSNPKQEKHCGSCSACLTACPTDAFVAPFVLDARRCISYLTIEHEGSIAEDLRAKMGNRIYGCDDCQLVCTGISSPHYQQSQTLHHGGIWTIPIWSSSSLGRKTSSLSDSKAHPSDASVTRSGFAILRWHSAMLRPHPKFCRHLRVASTMRHRLSENTWSGHSVSTAKLASKLRRAVYKRMRCSLKYRSSSMDSLISARASCTFRLGAAGNSGRQ